MHLGAYGQAYFAAETSEIVSGMWVPRHIIVVAAVDIHTADIHAANVAGRSTGIGHASLFNSK